MKTHRLFFALWPTDQVRGAIVKTISKLPQKIKGRDIKSQNLHITLHFVGLVTEENKDCMHAAAQSISSAAFECNLDHVGHFSRAKIFWMGSREWPAELMQLHNKLGAAIGHCAYQQEKRVYAPHVTLKRKCVNPGANPMDFSIPWFVDEFVLVESVTHPSGVEYRVIEKYPLL